MEAVSTSNLFSSETKKTKENHGHKFFCHAHALMTGHIGSYAEIIVF